MKIWLSVYELAAIISVAISPFNFQLYNLISLLNLSNQPWLVEKGAFSTEEVESNSSLFFH